MLLLTVSVRLDSYHVKHLRSDWSDRGYALSDKGSAR